MDTNNQRSLFSILKVFIIILILLGAVKAIQIVKSYDSIGYGQNGPATITVSGEGSVMATPDIADLSFTVSADATTAKDAQDKVSTIVTPALAAVKASGVDDKDVQASSYQLNPKYDTSRQVVCFTYPCNQPTPKIIGYTVSETVEIKVRNVDSTSDILSKLAAAGVSNISGPNFVLDDPTAIQDQARAKAIADAQTRAGMLAKQLGVHLGKIMSFSDSGQPIYYAKNVMMSAGSSNTVAPTPAVPTGENKITSDVSVTYQIN